MFFVEGIVGPEACGRATSRMITLTQTAPGFHDLAHPFGLVPAEAVGLRVSLPDGRCFAGTIGARFFGTLSFASQMEVSTFG
ncbi:hypothetical protein D9M70_548270 [compost metagenome]